MQNFIVVKLSAIGDVIHALPVSYAIKETFPTSHLTWVVEPPAYPLLEENPYIDDLIVFPKKDFKSFQGFMTNYLPFRRRIRQRRYDASLDLQGLFKSASIIAQAGAREKYGTSNMREGSNLLSRPVRGAHAGGHIVERYLDVARAIGCQVEEVSFPITIPDEARARVETLLRAQAVPESRPYAVLAIGANWPNKRWPTNYYSALSDWLFGEGIIPILAGGGALDDNLAASIAATAQIPPVSLVGRTSLIELAALIDRAALVIGGDTGPVHMAAGLRRKTIMLLGPTDANRNGPYGQLENAIEIDRDCRYCWKRSCARGMDCLAKITVAEVQAKIRRVLNRPLRRGECP
ncbi:lipopolysaccharide heptosyltransferase I [Selenomonas sp. TAMA-11512]|uniref:glycosyltransferase family 9 protein n=1 Tax=Selenomonas sp. TAMA-11512 TaxID=3095337 RepID=UPI00309033C7|nr:lipopolysaccharide heptosyltransferase I [Selenomonas sp. TAMA-11512]